MYKIKHNVDEIKLLKKNVLSIGIIGNHLIYFP